MSENPNYMDEPDEEHERIMLLLDWETDPETDVPNDDEECNLQDEAD